MDSETDILLNRVLQSAGSGAFIALFFGSAPGWLPLLTAFVALLVECTKRAKRDKARKNVEDQLHAIWERIQNLPCSGNDNQGGNKAS